MSKNTATKLAIFNTFKTKGGLTGEANRQRSIILILAGSGNPTEKTRTGISQTIAKEHNIAWKNIYSGIFRDLDEVLIPMGMVEEHGRLPLRRGPKALQEKGIPYYHLTREGNLVALAINGADGQHSLLDQFFAVSEPEESEIKMAITKLQKSSPHFTYSIFQKYVKAFCDGKFKELLPINMAKFEKISDESLIAQRETLEAFMNLPERDRQKILSVLNRITIQDNDAQENNPDT